MMDENTTIEDIQTEFNDAYIADRGDETIFDVDELRTMRQSAQYGSGETNRKKFCAELEPEFVNSWKEFIVVFTGVDVKHGRGSVSSPLVQFSLKLFMALVADLDTDETENEFVRIIQSKPQLFDLAERMRTMSESLKRKMLSGNTD